MKIQNIIEHKSGDRYKIEQSYTYTGDDYWNWRVWIESSDRGLDKIDNVIYNLHYTFIEPVRIKTSRENKFMLETSGWGTFTIYAIINFKDKTILELEHDLELRYPDGKESKE